MAGKVTRSVSDRFWSKVGYTDYWGCWNWKGKLNQSGYGRFYDGKEDIRAHRYSYQIHKGQIPEGLELDHLCRNRGCVNPVHLEAVTRQENLLRGDTIPKHHSEKITCPKGHLLVEGNLVIAQLKLGRRSCLICHRERQYRYNHPNA